MVGIATMKAWNRLKLVEFPVPKIKQIYTINDLLDWLHDTGKQLEIHDYKRVKAFIEKIIELNQQITAIQDSIIWNSKSRFKEIAAINRRIGKLNSEIQKVSFIIIDYIELLHFGWTDDRKVVSLADIHQFVRKYRCFSELVKVSCYSID